MDYFSHGIWSYIFYHRTKVALYAVLFGTLPDTVGWVPFVIYRLATAPASFGPPNPVTIPDWVWFSYGISHSLIVFGVVVALVLAIKKSVPVYIWAWPLHIFIDIFTHTREYLATPFLWPLSDYKFSGISWGSPSFMIPNVIVMIGFLIYIYLKQSSKKVRKK